MKNFIYKGWFVRFDSRGGFQVQTEECRKHYSQICKCPSKEMEQIRKEIKTLIELSEI